MRRRSLVVVLLALVVVGLIATSIVLGVLVRPSPTPSVAHVANGHPAPARVLPIGNLVGFAFDWLGQPGVLGHRIAGRVVHAGAPVGRARTRLVTEELHVGEWVLAEVETDEAGRFDFGNRPATRYRVVAQAEGLVASGQVVDLRAPELRPAPDALEIELRDCTLVVSGTVRDAAGGVIVGARVRAGTYAEEFGGTVADAQGRYRVCLSAGPVHIEASADGYGTVLEHRQGRRELRVDFALSPEVVIAGRVVDASGGPAGGVAVAAETNGHDPGKVVDTAGDGQFRLDGLAAGSYRVSARDEGRAAEKTVVARTAGATIEVELTLEERAQLIGSVVVAGHAESGATVKVKDADDESTLGSAVAQRDGRFAIAGLPTRGSARVSVEGHRLVAPAATIDLAAVHGRELELVCERLAKVSGRVVSNGKPVVRADVWLGANRRSQRILSGFGGAFSIEGVEPGTYSLNAQSIGEGIMMARRSLEVGARDIDNLVLDLDLAASISGVVVDAAGAPVAGALVSFFVNGDSCSDVTAADGTFTCNGLAGDGDYVPRITASSAAGMAFRPASGESFAAVRVADGKSQVTGVRLVIARDDLSIAGKVVRGAEPVAGMNVTARSEHGQARAQTGADGAFVIAGLSAGTVRVSVMKDRGYSELATVDAKAGDKNVRLELPPLGTIEGDLRGFTGTKNVLARGPKGYFQADLSGSHFEIVDIPAGEYTVDASATNGAYGRSSVTVSGGAVSRLSFEAGPTGHIDGQVTNWRTGAPIVGAFCQWQVEGGLEGPTVQSESAGTFSFDAPARALDIMCFGSQGPSAPAHKVHVELAAGESTQVAIQLIVARNPRRRDSLQLGIDGDPPQIQFAHGSAERAGLLAGDHVVAVNGDAVAGIDRDGLQILLLDRAPGQAVKIAIERDGAQMSFDVLPEMTYPTYPR